MKKEAVVKPLVTVFISLFAIYHFSLPYRKRRFSFARIICVRYYRNLFSGNRGILSSIHSSPADISVYVIRKKSHKTNND